MRRAACVGGPFFEDFQFGENGSYGRATFSA